MKNNYQKSISRNKIIKISKELNIYHKNGTIKLNDKQMQLKSGHNKIIKITCIDKLENKYDIKELRRMIIMESLSKYTNNKNKHLLIKNKDTNIIFEIGRIGIRKTFSNRVPQEKLFTYNILKEILEQGIYLETLSNINDKTGIKYHNFITPVFIKGEHDMYLIRSVIKEYTKDKNMNPKFYYHQFEELNEKGTTSLNHIGIQE